MFLIIHGSLISEVIHSQTFTEYLLCVHCFLMYQYEDCGVEDREETFSHGVDILDLGYPNWQTFKERTEPLHMDS